MNMRVTVIALLALQLFKCPDVFASEAQLGKTIYMHGVDERGQAIPNVLNGLASEAAFGCVQCHRESGIGTSESGKTIPPVSWTLLGSPQPSDDSSRFYPIQNKRKAYDSASLHRVLTTGIDANGEPIDSLMPLYSVTREQSHQLMAYLKTLYTGPDPGVDADSIRIATIIDMRLPESQRQQHLKLLQGLVDMKNQLTRGELKRKQFSPIQKVPQYQSFRLWELAAWELPVETDNWQPILQQYYQADPAFVVMRPLLLNDYDRVAAFCSDNRLPCLFASGHDMPSGDYFNFSLRDVAKQHADYLAQLRRENRDGADLWHIGARGDIVPLANGSTRLPLLSRLDPVTLQKDFQMHCGKRGFLLARATIDQARIIDQLTCPVDRKIQIRLLNDERNGYQAVRDYLSSHPDSSLCWVSDYDKALARNAGLARVQALVSRFDIRQPDDESIALTLFTYALVSDALHQMAGHFSRTYLLEILEHMLNSFPNYTFFSSVSGAPYRRYLSGPIREYCAGNSNP